MGEDTKRDISNVIEEIDSAYKEFSDYSYMNADYPYFARMAVGQFRRALGDPDLTREDLEKILRKGIVKYRQTYNDNPLHSGKNWVNFVASYMATASNANDIFYDFSNVADSHNNNA